MICPKCKKENDKLETICVNCGEPLTPGFQMCPVCGKVLKEGDKVCPRCNSNIYELSKSVSIKKKETKTPMYVGKVSFSFLIILAVLISMILTFIYLVNHLENVVVELACGILSAVILLINLLLRIFMNTTNDVEVLEKRVNAFKTFFISLITAYIFMGVITVMPLFLKMNHLTVFEIVLFVVYFVVLIIVSIFTPIFYRKSKVRSR